MHRLPGRLSLAGSLLLAGGLTLTSCKGGNQPAGAPAGTPGTPAGTTSSAPAGQQPTIQIITNGISPFWDPMAAGMNRAAKKFKCQASWAGPQTAAIPDQKRMNEDAISRKGDGLA